MHNSRLGHVTLLSCCDLTPVLERGGAPVCPFTAFLHPNLDLFTTIADCSCALIAKLLHMITFGECNLVYFFLRP